jgi:PAS domain S-box-containing protein
MQNTNPKTIRPAKKDDEAIKLPILAPLFVAITVLLVIFTLAIYRLQQQNIRDDVRMRLDSTRRYFDKLLAADARFIGETTHFVKDNPDIQNAWLARDHDKLLGLSAPIFEKLHHDYKITHLYFIDTNDTCFLRVHNPPRFGDRINRFTLKSAAETVKPYWGIELGPYGTFTLRVVQPWVVNNTLTGFIEFGEEIEHIAPQLKETLNVDMVFLINKTFLARDSWQEGLKMMGHSGNWDLIPNCVIADSTTPSIPPEFIKLAGLPHGKQRDQILSAKLDGSTFSAGFIKLSDASGREVGSILVIKNVSKELASLHALLAVIATLCFLIASALISFFYIHIAGIEKRLIHAHASLATEIEKRKETEAELRKHRDNLEKTVKNRTAELEETNKHLQKEIVEHNKTENALRKGDERFKQVAESAGDWIWEVNAEGLYTYSSPVAEKVLGYKPEEIVGKRYFYDFFAPEVKEEFKKAAIEAFNKKEKLSGFVNPNIHKNGSTVILETTGTPILDDEGNLCGYRGADRDITERDKAQQRQTQLLEQLEKSNRRLQQENTQRIKAEKSLEKLNDDLEFTVAQLSRSNKQLREFDHLAAHDLKTPLRGIGTLAQWLLNDYYDKFDDHGRKQVDLLVRRVMRMDDLINAILQYSTIARNKQNERQVDLNPMIKAVLADFQPTTNITLTVNKNFPVLTCEEEQIRQVFYNLVANAVKFTDKPDGRITIDCEDEKYFWKFSVTDNGQGIEPQHFERIFRLFQTLSNHEEAESIGIGLTIAKKIVELYGGKIWLTSTVGVGSTFFFTLPKQPTAVPCQSIQQAQT